MALPLIETIFPRTNGPQVKSVGTIYRAIADKTVANTVTETSLVGTGVTGQSVTLGANFFNVGTSIRWRLMGYLSDTGTPTIQIKVKLGSTVIYDTTAQTLPSLTGNQLFFMEGRATCRTTGATGTIFATSEVFCNTGASSLGNLDIVVPTAAVTIDTTSSQVFDVTATWGTASASNTITINNFSLDLNT